jgi:hypothetical protein
MVRLRVPPSAGRKMEHEPSLSRQASAGRTSAVESFPRRNPALASGRYSVSSFGLALHYLLGRRRSVQAMP